MAYDVRFGLGFAPIGTSLTTMQVNAANSWHAWGITGRGVALNKVMTYSSVVTGTLLASEITMELYSANTSDGKPNASIEGPISCDTAPSGAGWHQWSGFTTTLTSGLQYYLVIKNVNATPASNYVTIRIAREYIYPIYQAGANNDGMNRYTSSDGGSSWSNAYTGIAGMRFEFAGPTYRGIPVWSLDNLGVSYGVYSTRESGAKITSPANAIVKAIGVWVQAGAISGSPTGEPRLGLRVGADAAVYTHNINRVAMGTANIVRGYFSSAKSIPASSVCRITLGETANSDASTARYNLYGWAVQDTAASKALFPFGGMPLTYYDGSSWAETDTYVCACGLILDDASEFGAYGVKMHPGMNGNFNG